MNRRSRRTDSTTPPPAREPSPPRTPRRPAGLAGGTLLAAIVFAGGLLVSGGLSSAADCPLPLGCITTVVPTLPLPGVTVPTIGTTTDTTTTGTTTTGTTSGTTTPTQTGTTTQPTRDQQEQAAKTGNAALSARASARVRGQGARRIVEIRLRLSKRVRGQALLTRSGRVLAQRTFQASAGASVVELRVARPAKPGPVALKVVLRSVAGEVARLNARLVLPR